MRTLLADARRLCVLASVVLAACGPAATPATPPAGASNPPPAATIGGPAAGAAIAPAAGGAPAPAATAPPVVQLKVGTQRLSSDVVLYTAQERGYFAEQGFEVEFTDITTGGEAIPPLATGQLDVSVGAVNPGLFNAIQRGVDLKLVSTKGATGPDPSSPFAGGITLALGPDVAASGAIRDYADLRGRPIAISTRGSALEVILDKALHRGGLTLNDVDVRTLGYPDMLPALANHQVDAAIELEPFVAQGAAKGVLVPWKNAVEIYPGQQAAALLYGPSMLQMGGNAGNRFMVAYVRGLRDYNDAFGPKHLNRADMVGIMIRNTPVKDPALYDQMGLTYLNPDCYLNLDTMAADVDWYFENGYIAPKPDVTQYVDHSYCDYALQQLGRYQP
ncbi:MAG TPA: ABC transporter substrate-binding protein [Chloroflexota bacterium]|nr:ABC transporter substrate-binding protein [Chloroflexota bacterium]